HIATLMLVFLAFMLTQGVLLPSWVKVHDSVKGVILDGALLSSLGIFGNYGSVNEPSWSISVEMWAGSIVMLAFFRSWIVAVPFVVVGAFALIQPDISVKGGGGGQYLALSSGVWRCIFGMSLGVLVYKFFEKT